LFQHYQCWNSATEQSMWNVKCEIWNMWATWMKK
jgi:hypothetical protein